MPTRPCCSCVCRACAHAQTRHSGAATSGDGNRRRRASGARHCAAAGRRRRLRGTASGAGREGAGWPACAKAAMWVRNARDSSTSHMPLLPTYSDTVSLVDSSHIGKVVLSLPGTLAMARLKPCPSCPLVSSPSFARHHSACCCCAACCSVSSAAAATASCQGSSMAQGACKGWGEARGRGAAAWRL